MHNLDTVKVDGNMLTRAFLMRYSHTSHLEGTGKHTRAQPRDHGPGSGLQNRQPAGKLLVKSCSYTCSYRFPTRSTNSSGNGIVTLPVAAHSVPRFISEMNPAPFIASGPWPSAMRKTRPAP